MLCFEIGILIGEFSYPISKILKTIFQMGNHDQHRVASRFGENIIDLLNMILMSLPGVAITYNVSLVRAATPKQRF